MRARRWLFTYFFEDPATIPEALPPRSDFLVFGWELCPTTKRAHLQGYIEWNHKASLLFCREFLEANWTIAGGDQQQNITYCTKDGDWVEFGTRKTQGARSDLLSVKRSIDEGSSVPQLWDDHFSSMVRYHKAFQVYKKIKAIKRSWKTKVVFIVGPAGTQKTTLATLLAYSFGSSVYTIPEAKGSGLYFDGYDGEDVVILDEMDGKRMQPTVFNGLADKFEYSVPVHGCGNINWAPYVMFVISNYLPKYWWRKRTADQLLQTTRRIDWTIKRLRPLKARNPMLILSRFPPLALPIMSFNL